MKLIKPFYKIESKIDSDEILKAIEIAGRTCYKSEDKITLDSAKEFVRKIIKSGHESVIEHQSLSIRFICDRGVSHELVRHRLASFSQESTRYCNYSNDKFNNQLTFIIPCWFNVSDKILINYINNHIYQDDTFTDGEACWLESMENSEKYYNFLIEHNWTPQQARSVLPNSLKTEIVITANLREWRTIFKQRTSKAAHPQMRELMRPLLDELKIKISAIFDDISYE